MGDTIGAEYQVQRHPSPQCFQRKEASPVSSSKEWNRQAKERLQSPFQQRGSSIGNVTADANQTRHTTPAPKKSRCNIIRTKTSEIEWSTCFKEHTFTDNKIPPDNTPPISNRS
ncbi:hypothetical protein Nepgr_011660 [Nepenthes gracilis]|uniref:Uncharacterized protein n=1 Tax=Nepenthes gracilis TaxID=150966 RepID=A0AAD3SF86_NEPGR|nr:hypothetical protein Nepgr_011660 [Nepenthes gracilis]